MPIPRAGGALLACTVACLGGVALPASAATTDIGAVSEIRGDMPPDPNTAAGGDGLYVVQVGEAAGTYAVPAGYGVITAWSHRTGTTPGALSFKVYRPTGTAGRYLTVAASARTVKVGAINEFPVRIPVRPADRIGISTTTVQVAYTTLNPVDQMGFFSFRAPDPPPGSIATLDGLPGPNYRADVAARIETDRDADGFGDDTQDGCPTSPAAQGACPGVTLPAFTGCPALAANVIRGKAAADRIDGTLRGDRIFGGGGGDTVAGLGSDDCIDLGTGNDRGMGGPGDDLLLGGPGGDRVSGSSGNDRLLGDSGNDRIAGGPGKDRLSGDSGNDRLAGDSGNDRIAGGPGKDRLTGGSGVDRISGGSGRDRVSARDRRRDRISCGSGRDTVSADRVDRVARDCERVRRSR